MFIFVNKKLGIPKCIVPVVWCLKAETLQKYLIKYQKNKYLEVYF